MIDRYKHQQLRIGLVFPQQISAWSTKILPNGEIVGEVTKPYTFHYKTNKPEKDGLFCERFFVMFEQANMAWLQEFIHRRRRRIVYLLTHLHGQRPWAKTHGWKEPFFFLSKLIERNS